MRLFYFPVQDASIYSSFVNRNSGLDEILEVGKVSSGSRAARALIQFDIPSVSSSLGSTIPLSANYELKLYIAYADMLKSRQQVNVFPVSGTWEEGTGYFYQDLYQENDGVTWRERMSGSLWSTSGSEYYTIVSASATASVPVEDFTFDVSDFVHGWLSGSLTDGGFIIKFPDADETTIRNKGIIKFFSKDTHTIFKPVLVVKWDDQSYFTGSLTVSTFSNLSVTPIPKYAYVINETARIDLAVRDKFVTKTVDTRYRAYSGDRYLPTSSYYSIIDVQSGHTIIPFSEESKVSCDASGSFVKFKVQNMYPLRYYTIRIKVNSNGETQIFDGG